MKKTRLLSLALCLALCLTLLPTAALAADDLPKGFYDVYQGDGFYITATPFVIQSPKYERIRSQAFLGQVFHDGMIAVRTADVDENYVNRTFVDEYNFVDKNGKIMFPEGIFKYTGYAAGSIKSCGAEGDLSPSEGLVPYWDGESKDNTGHVLMGLVDYNGKVVIGCQYEPDDLSIFSEGVSLIDLAESTTEHSYFINKSGSTTLELPHSYQVRNSAFFSDGLMCCFVNDRASGRGTMGFIDKSGQMVLELLSYDLSDAETYGKDYWKMCADGKTDGYLMPLLGQKKGEFSEGYAVCYDLRSGNQMAYSYAIIDTRGSVVGTFSDAEPMGVRSSRDAWGGFHSGLMRVGFIDNRGNTSGYGYIDPKGEVVIREKDAATGSWHVGSNVGDFNSGLLVTEKGLVDTKGNIILPTDTPYPHFSLAPFSENLSLSYLSNGYGGETPYILEKHSGTYSGPGTIYNAAKGSAVTVPTQPETPPVQPSGDMPSSWAAEPVKAAVAAGIVPEALQSQYGQAITRAEFCALAVELYETVTGSEIADRLTFTDTNDPNVEKMAALKVVNGEGDGIFNPDGKLTRQQAAAMLSRLADALNKPLSKQETTFADKAAFSAYAVEPIGQMQATGVMNGVGDNKFDPNGAYTREQSIVTMMRLFDIVK